MMRRRSKRPGPAGTASKQDRNWAARAAIALGLSVLGYFCMADSLAYALVGIDPMRAHALAPANGAILGSAAQEEFARRPVKDAGSLPANLARRALLADPTSAKALTVLGFQAQLRGDTAGAGRLFSYSNQLTRRELRPRMWAIEEAVSRGDIGAALRHYDIALRTSDEGASMLYPTLAAALSQPRIRAELLPILATRPVWRASFLAYAASSRIEPAGAIALLSDGARIGLTPTAEMSANLVDALLSRNKPEAAWEFYRRSRPGARKDHSRDPGFVFNGAYRAKFDWRVEDAGLGASFVPGPRGGFLDFAVPPGIGGVLVSQAQVLPEGAYRLEGRSRALRQPDRSTPYWTVTCSDGGQLARFDVADSQNDDGLFSGRFRVPKGCAWQTLSLVARASDDIVGVTGQIEYVAVRPVR